MPSPAPSRGAAQSSAGMALHSAPFQASHLQSSPEATPSPCQRRARRAPPRKRSTSMKRVGA
eukprot:7384012-Prymnesium_polylepis.2